MSEIGKDLVRVRYDSAAQIGYVEEILINILSRLPVKTAGACKSVAKHWFNLISEPNFAKLQLSHSQKNLKFIICPYPEESDILTHLSLLEGDGKISQTLPLPGFDMICSPDMTCFLNGLICSVNEVDCDDVNIRIFNPTTQETLLLPQGKPSLIPPSVGLVFDPENIAYKVFRFFMDSLEDGKCKCEVYGSDSTVWRMISEDIERPDPSPFCPMCPCYVSVAGKMYWFVWSEQEPSYPVHIISVDLNDNFSRIDLPKSLTEWSFLIEFEGCLTLVWVVYPDHNASNLFDHLNPFLEVWKLQSSGWYLRASGVLKMNLVDIRSFNSVAARENEIFFIVNAADDSPHFCIFDLVDRTLKTIDLGDTFEGYSPVAFPFSESLLKCS